MAAFAAVKPRAERYPCVSRSDPQTDDLVVGTVLYEAEWSMSLRSFETGPLAF